MFQIIFNKRLIFPGFRDIMSFSQNNALLF